MGLREVGNAGTRGRGGSEGKSRVPSGAKRTAGNGRAGAARGAGSSLPAEDVLGVASPDLVLALVGAAGEGAGARGTARHHVEARLGQLVEGLLQEV